ncbi:TetR/AcrR family transcriptional regulator [Mycobacterium numidiamassiliense]|uniref:TetR/AcrR family transcriptional regulator n=1 Tax=Mycobacterium numidiamassiliense TaxID=1841861 RepID=UPI00097DDE2A|nr:TetR/AcrR family transcriptional regulator [Mycobacterium numidiamassiliense]
MSIAESRGSDHGDLADRILDATQRLVFRTGARKLSLSDVANLAGVSRPTIYRYFASKDGLVDALGKRERRRFNAAMDNAMSGVVGVARLEAAVDVVASFVEAQPPGHLLDLEPDFAHGQMAAALPMLADGLVAVLQLCASEGAITTALAPRDLAGAIARTALSHYIFPDTDRAAARREIRAAAGLSGRAWVSARTVAGRAASDSGNS